ncbi:MAG TPA: hypothetical protein VFF06_00795 [Polyangia bacterium]|nr:hypothetical protein [Polyangia bacterium]
MLTLPADALAGAHGRRAPELLDRHLALRLTGAIGERERREWLAAIAAARAEWTPCFDGAQFTVGRAWYTHLEEDRANEYFARAAQSDAAVQRLVPGMQEQVLALFARLLGGPVARRDGFCGPGVHVFPAGGLVAARGGDIHYDLEGLPPAHVAASAPAFSLVVMLQPPESGGDLRVWPRRHPDEEHAPPDCASESIPYAAGDLVCIDSYRLHQIQPFSGARDRISITAHAALDGDRWLVWF